MPVVSWQRTGFWRSAVLRPGDGRRDSLAPVLLPSGGEPRRLRRNVTKPTQRD